eukprot:1158988-Pelagomonas_calceolata.AAC.9
MTGDLKNLRAAAYFLSKTEIKFDLVSAVDELNKQIRLEFDFTSRLCHKLNINEARPIEVWLGVYKTWHSTFVVWHAGFFLFSQLAKANAIGTCCLTFPGVRHKKKEKVWERGIL